MFNPLSPKSDQDQISPYNINTQSREQVMRKYKMKNCFDLLTNSPNTLRK